MTPEAAHSGQPTMEEFSSTFSKVFSNLVIRMQEVDDWCVQMTQDITKQELMLIDFIGEGKEIIMRDIADFLQTPQSTATGIVDKLVKKDYLKRYYSEEDRRTIRIGLTAKGASLKTLFCDKKKETSEAIASILTEEEKSQIISIFKKIDSNF